MKEELKPVFLKEIYFDEITGKIIIHDSNNNDYECNLYGEKITKFLPNVTGLLNFKERNEKKHYINIVSDDDSRKIYHPQKSIKYYYLNDYILKKKIFLYFNK